LAFFFGLAKYIFQAGNEDATERGRRIMVGGTLALFLIATVGGIIQFLAGALDIDTEEPVSPPRIEDSY
jgi:hypothetical protein